MGESSKKILDLTEAMRAERNVRIRNRMMAVMGVLKGHSTKTTSDSADVEKVVETNPENAEKELEDLHVLR